MLQRMIHWLSAAQFIVIFVAAHNCRRFAFVFLILPHADKSRQKYSRQPDPLSKIFLQVVEETISINSAVLIACELAQRLRLLVPP